MARKPRFTRPGDTQHIIQRGIDRQACFYSTGDCQLYLHLLHEAAQRYGCHVHAYVLMTNHVHLLVTPQQPCGISFMMQRLAQRYVRAINRIYQRTGTLWEGRYKACLVDTDRYLLTCMRYIELNPIRARMVAHPSDYAWSSYRYNGQGASDPVVEPHPLYIQLGREQRSRRQAYRELYTAHIEPGQLHEIRHTVNQELVLGSGVFKQQVEAMRGRQTREKPKGRPRKDGGPEEY
ncbi:MAG TPA: transposase [Gammaproteobacteria bacterium]|jgi:putative transposase|nr:transposase [Gammaproteobacteria bacterium]